MGRTLVALCPSHDAQELDRGCVALFITFAEVLDPGWIQMCWKTLSVFQRSSYRWCPNHM